MSTFKRVISIVLCIAMLAGSFAIVGDLATPKASAAEGTSPIKTYAELADAYDNFVYVGSEVYEIETDTGDLTGNVTDSILTDTYVDAGQKLMFKVYIKSDMYVGNSGVYQIFENDFFDVTQVTSTVPATYTSGVATTVNSDHPMVADGGTGLNVKMTSKNANWGWILNATNVDKTTLPDLDYAQGSVANTASVAKTAHTFQSDEWVYTYYAKVLDTVSEGDTGKTWIDPYWYKSGPVPVPEGETADQNNGRLANFPVGEITEGSTAPLLTALSSMMAAYNNGDFNYFLVDDSTYTFTCGANPAAGGETTKTYTVSFVNNSGEEISSAEYKEGAAVTVPAAAENQLGWADVSTGKLADLTAYTARKNATFQQVLSTDEFKVTVNLGGGTIDVTDVPNASIDENGNLVISAAFNETIDLSTLPTPEKEGYEATWTPATVTVDSIKGATAKVSWTAKTYTISFYNNKGDAEPVEVQEKAYGTVISCSKAVAADGYKFAGWIDADTDTQVSTTANLGKYTYTTDKSFYAAWTKYDSSISFYVKDYDNGSGWKLYTTKYGSENTTLTKASIETVLSSIETDLGVTIKKQTGINTPYIYDAETTSGNRVDISTGIKFIDNTEDDTETYDTKYYVFTDMSFNITWKVPAFDEATGTFTDDYDETTSIATIDFSSTKYSVNAKTDADLTAPTGYVFSHWTVEGTDEAVEYGANGVTLDSSFDRNLVLVAEFTEAEYELVFNIKNGDSPDKLTASIKAKLGEKIDLSNATFTNQEGKEMYLPEIGKENSELKTKFRNQNGYKFMGWTIGSGANTVDVTFPVAELTAEMINTYATGLKFDFAAKWEGETYKLKFFYQTADSDPTADFADRKYAELLTLDVKTGETFDKTVTAEMLAVINSNMPEGYRFANLWLDENGKAVVDSKMKAYGMNLYASYSLANIAIYIDYNNGKTDEEGNALPLTEIMVKAPQVSSRNPVLYGDDLERLKDIEAGIDTGIGRLIKRSIITDAYRPGENYEVVSWNVYHVDEGKDIYDKANWKTGVNDEGTNLAYTTVIYQPQWKHHTEFFFRVYGTDGLIYMALGKDFKLYYWNNNYVCDRSETSLKKDENLVVLMLIPEIENWDWDRFFDGEMWSNLTLRFDPLQAPKSMFTPEGMLGLFKALGNLIKSLL